MKKVTYKYVFLIKIILSFLLLILFSAMYFPHKKHIEFAQNRVLWIVDVSSEMSDEPLSLSGIKVWIKSVSQSYFS